VTRSWTSGTQPLVLSSYTLGTEVSFEDRVRVAAQAGFAGIGLRAENYWAAREAGLDDAAMREILDRYDVAVMEVEYLTGWGTVRDRDAAQQRKERTVAHLARTFGVSHLNAGLLEHLPTDTVVTAFADLCRRAGELTVALEFMPYSGVPDLRTAWHVLQRADVPNAGLVVDAWHWSRARMTAADLDPVAAEAVVAVQLCDVVRVPMDPPRAESLGHRLPPGHGYGDVAGMLQALAAKGIDPAVVTVEVISAGLVAQGSDVAARTSYAAARAVRARVR
jgi:sugar phosphate isomerase/epimerase